MPSSPTTIPVDEAKPEQIASRISALKAKIPPASVASFRDCDLQRFLIARQYDVDKALEMVNNYIKWKTELKVDEIPLPNGSSVPYLISTRKLYGIPDTNYDPNAPGVREDFAKFYPATGGGCYHGFDKDGRPLYIDRLGLFEVRQFADSCSPETFRDFFIRNFEFMFRMVTPQASKATGKPVEQVTVIMDCTGMGIRQFHIPGIMLLKVLADLLQNYHPERLVHLYIVNAPIFFNAAWAIIKVWLDKRIIDKVHVLSSDYAEVLTENIDHHQLPSFLGGSCTCSHMDGGCVPPTRGQKIVADPNGYRFTKTLKKSSNSHSHEVEVKHSDGGSQLNYQFESSAALTLEIHESESKTKVHSEVDQTKSQGVVHVSPGKKYVVSWKTDQISYYSSAKLDYSLNVVNKGSTTKSKEPSSPDEDVFEDAQEGMSNLQL